MLTPVPASDGEHLLDLARSVAVSWAMSPLIELALMAERTAMPVADEREAPFGRVRIPHDLRGSFSRSQRRCGHPGMSCASFLVPL